MARGLYAGTSGNISARTAGGMLITPAACRATTSTPRPSSETFEGAAGGHARGRLAPSTEWRIHRDIYRRRPEIGAVVHTHSMFATALSCLRRPIPAFHYMVAKAGGDDIRCARYATYGTAALSRNALAALAGGRRACLLANHGLLALGADLASARLLAEEIEALCAQYIHARAAGTPVVLPAREMKRVRAKFATYGGPLTLPSPRRAGRGNEMRRSLILILLLVAAALPALQVEAQSEPPQIIWSGEDLVFFARPTKPPSRRHRPRPRRSNTSSSASRRGRSSSMATSWARSRWASGGSSTDRATRSPRRRTCAASCTAK